MEKVFERDIDLLMINKFCSEEKVTKYFSSKIGLDNYKVVKAQHSIMDENGESDITIILENEATILLAKKAPSVPEISYSTSSLAAGPAKTI